MTSKNRQKRGAAKTKPKHPFDNEDGTEKAVALQKRPNDPERMRDFYEVMKPMIARALKTKFARDTDDFTRDDLCQDILMKLMRKIEQFDPGKAKLFNWATSIVRTMSIDYYRKVGREIPTEALKDVPVDQRATWLETDADTLSEMRAFFPFYVSTRVFNDLFAAIERYNFKPNNNMVSAIGQIFKDNSIEYKAHGTLQDFAQFLVALYRAWMIQDSPHLAEKLQVGLKNHQKVGVTRVLAHYMTSAQIAVLLHICGGMTVKLPLPRQLLEAKKPGTR